MTRTYQPKLLADGSPNPKYKPDKRKRKGDRHAKRARGKIGRPPRDGVARAKKKNGFIGWDGEGVTVNGKHRYIMLLSSDGDRLVKPEGLSTLDCLHHLADGGARNKTRHHVGFAFSYDSNMILGDLPRDTIKLIWKGATVEWEGFKIRYRPRRELTIVRIEDKARICIWDVFGFFQCSFVEALRQYKIASADHIESMKLRRAIFTLDEIDDIEKYCAEECQYMEDLASKFGDYLIEAGLTISRFDGAGAVAGALLRVNDVDKHRKRQPKKLTKAAQHAYYGGRIEMVQYGHNPRRKVYQYDLRSAYPAAMQNAPCLYCGDWKWSRDSLRTIQEFSLYHIEWELTGNVLPFPWRSPDGSVFFPRTGEGWYWGCEVIAAKEALRRGVIGGKIKIRERWEYEIKCTHKPFGWVPKMYKQRAQWKAEGIGAEKVLKLGLNSIYGKTAQRIGGQFGRAPKWHQIEWSGYTTSKTRAELYKAALPAIAIGAAVMFATDAIVSLVKLPQLTIGEELGQWDLAEYTGLTAVQSGVYWLGEEHAAHTRGFRPDELDPMQIVAAWKRGDTIFPAKARRFIAMGRAIMGDVSWSKWRQWLEEPRELHLSPSGTKRALPIGLRDVGRFRVRPENGLIQTIPADVEYWQLKRKMTTPIALPWEDSRHRFNPTKSYALLSALDESEDGHE